MKIFLKKWFTIIETIIAIIIFGAWILVLLIILNKNILLSKKVYLSTQATLLAKQGMEIVYNLRDSNNIKFQEWNYLTWEDTTKQYFWPWKSYLVWTELTWYKNRMEEISNPNFLNTRLYLKTWDFLNSVWETIYSWFYYNYLTWEKTPFARYVSFTWAYLSWEWIMTKNIYKISSIVKYQYWAISWNIILEWFISNWR